MSSIFNPSSDIELIDHLQKPAGPVERSYSKRLYTFFYYQYSIHLRLHVILFFVIIFVTFAIAWLISGLARLRQTASYSESCAAGKVRCLAGSNLVCSLATSICLCPQGSYWSSADSKCLSVKGKDGFCTSYEQCNFDVGLICHSNGTCQCPANTYYENTRCTLYLPYDSTCSSSSIPICDSHLGLICDNSTQRCVCPTSTYWNYARCEKAASYDEYCSHNTTCDSQLGLFCRLSNTDPSCDCPNPSRLYTCDCQSGYSWVTTSSSNNTSTCIKLDSYLSNCTSDSQCQQLSNLFCIGGRCDCMTPFWFWSTQQSRCVSCESLGYTLVYYQSQSICTRFVNDSLMSYTASKSTCLSIGWSLISPIFAADILAIAQFYPTYRLWMNMETVVGSSVYSNNIFPNNQSNWNGYVLTLSVNSYNTQTYAAQLIPPYNTSYLFEANIALDMGHALCMLY